MKQEIKSLHRNDSQGRPAGGITTATGLAVIWQDGPLGIGPTRTEPNGCFVETVIEAARDRLGYYQASGFACHENAAALHYLDNALRVLEERTAKRQARGVEGTHEV